MNKLDNKTKQERLAALEIILDLYPDLKKNKDDILMHVLEKYGKPIKYILTKYTREDGNIYYVDPNGMLVDKYLNFKGIVNDGKFYFNDIDKNMIDVKYYDKIMKYKK